MLCTAPNKMTKHFQVIYVNACIFLDAISLPANGFQDHLILASCNFLFLILQSWPQHPSLTSSRAPWDPSALTRCWSTTLAYVLHPIQIKEICDNELFCNQMNYSPTFSACLGAMAGRDHHQRWSHHPEAAGGGAPGCQGPLRAGRSPGQGGRRWDHFCGKQGFSSGCSTMPYLVSCFSTMRLHFLTDVWLC